MEHWAKKISKKLPQNMFKTRLDSFGNDFEQFWNFENFLIFLKNFWRLDPPWKTGQKIFEKNLLIIVQVDKVSSIFEVLSQEE